MSDHEFDEWKTWFDSHKEPDGTIDLSKHPELQQYLVAMFKPPNKNFKDLAGNLGLTVNYEIHPRR